VILSDGRVTLYEGRDSFHQEAASYERAQIVRLDPRQITMLRYHLGMSFEDVFTPLKGETDVRFLRVSFPTVGADYTHHFFSYYIERHFSETTCKSPLMWDVF
jgi:hypothetical protein